MHRVEREGAALGDLAWVRSAPQLEPQGPRDPQYILEQRGRPAPAGRPHLAPLCLQPAEERIDLVGSDPGGTDGLGDVIERNLSLALEQGLRDLQQFRTQHGGSLAHLPVTAAPHLAYPARVAPLEADRIEAGSSRLWIGGAGACVLGGLWLRLYELWRPPFFAFDEHHFVENARNYLQRLPDFNDHPPLGKLLIALGISLFGDTSAGWRCAPALFGAATIAVAALLARRLFPGSLAWAFALVFVSLDGFAIAYSRVALLDGMLSCLLLLSCWLALGTRASALIAAAIAGGLALSIKFSGVCYLAPLACALLTRPGSGRLRWLLLAPMISTLVYYACFALGLWISRAPWDPLSVWQATLELIHHHAGLIDMQNPSTSSWVTWFVPTRPITLWRTVEGSTLRSVTSRGNPLLWACCSASVLGLTGAVTWRGLAPTLNAGKFRIRSLWLPARSLVYLLTAYWACLAPWILTRRDSYIYHYLPSHLFAIVLVSGLCGSLYRARRDWALGFAAAVILVSAQHAARWAGLPRTIAEPSASTLPQAAP